MKQKKKCVLYLVIPCYNEEEVLSETTKRLTDKMDRMIASGCVSEQSKIMYIDDGSKDGTWQLIESFYRSNPYVLGVKLSRNKGHQNALLAGLMTAKKHCDCAISMDADLQDDIEVLDKFVAEYQNGCDVVYGVRSERKTDTRFKRASAQSFYKLMHFFGVDIVYNHADYRLMSQRALHDLGDYKEVNLFLRGIVPQIGYQTATVEYERGERFAGDSKYPLHKMVGFAADGITSFSVKPIQMIVGVGSILFAAAIVYLLSLLIRWGMGHSITGWMLVGGFIWLLGGLQMVAIGIVGLYVGKTYMESKQRPRYIIETTLLPSSHL